MRPDKATITDIVADVVALIMKEYDACPKEAMLAFYASPVYKALEEGDKEMLQRAAQELFAEFKNSKHLR